MYPSQAVVVAGLDLSLNGLDRESQHLKRPAVGTEPQTARFEVQILGEELFSLLRHILRQYVAFYFPLFILLGNTNPEPFG